MIELSLITTEGSLKNFFVGEQYISHTLGIGILAKQYGYKEAVRYGALRKGNASILLRFSCLQDTFSATINPAL